MTIATRDKDMIQTAKNTYNLYYPGGIEEHTRVPQNDRYPLVAAHLGFKEDIRHLLANQILSPPTDQFFTDTFGPGIMPNRISLQAQIAMDFERYGNNALILHASLLQSVPSSPGGEPVIYLFPAWPDDWDASFKLAARGGFLVSASIEHGKIKNVGIESRTGGKCRLQNPWPGKTLDLLRDEKKAGELSGSLLTFQTVPGEMVELYPGE